MCVWYVCMHLHILNYIQYGLYIYIHIYMYMYMYEPVEIQINARVHYLQMAQYG